MENIQSAIMCASAYNKTRRELNYTEIRHAQLEAYHFICETHASEQFHEIMREMKHRIEKKSRIN